jgi:hypothetical protein
LILQISTSKDREENKQITPIQDLSPCMRKKDSYTDDSEIFFDPSHVLPNIGEVKTNKTKTHKTVVVAEQPTEDIFYHVYSLKEYTDSTNDVQFLNNELNSENKAKEYKWLCLDYNESIDDCLGLIEEFLAFKI